MVNWINSLKDWRMQVLQPRFFKHALFLRGFEIISLLILCILFKFYGDLIVIPGVGKLELWMVIIFGALLATIMSGIILKKCHILPSKYNELPFKFADHILNQRNLVFCVLLTLSFLIPILIIIIFSHSSHDLRMVSKNRRESLEAKIANNTMSSNTPLSSQDNLKLNQERESSRLMKKSESSQLTQESESVIYSECKESSFTSLVPNVLVFSGNCGIPPSSSVTIKLNINNEKTVLKGFLVANTSDWRVILTRKSPSTAEHNKDLSDLNDIKIKLKKGEYELQLSNYSNKNVKVAGGLILQFE